LEHTKEGIRDLSSRSLGCIKFAWIGTCFGKFLPFKKCIPCHCQRGTSTELDGACYLWQKTAVLQSNPTAFHMPMIQLDLWPGLIQTQIES
jgi:hypothetical protein